MRFRLLVTLSTIALVSACAPPEADDGESDQSALSNGNVANTSAFPATLQIEGNCTVTHIAPKLILTAAHCVREESGSIAEDFTPGKQFFALVRGTKTNRRPVTITKTTIHPRIAALCGANACGGSASGDRRDAPDVAVIEIDGGLDDVPTAQIDVGALAVGDAVTILGYGCQGVVDVGDDDGQLRVADTKVVATSATIHEGGLEKTETTALETVRANYAITPGPLTATKPNAPANAGLCPGDSGGPLYRKGTNRVVGVNASYTFVTDGTLPVTNWHARVGGDARWGVAAWLESMGANMTRKCTAAACRPARSVP